MEFPEVTVGEHYPMLTKVDTEIWLSHWCIVCSLNPRVFRVSME